MKTLTLHDIAARSANASDIPVILIDVANQGTASRIHDGFPSIDKDARNALNDDEPCFLEFSTHAEAIAAYEEICRDLMRECGCLEGFVTLVHPNGDTAAHRIAA